MGIDILLSLVCGILGGFILGYGLCRKAFTKMINEMLVNLKKGTKNE